MIKLQSVPSQCHELNRKASISGVVYLKEGKFKSRYVGNKHSSVDINGNLWLKSSDLKKEISGPATAKVATKKNAPSVETEGVKKLYITEKDFRAQISENLCTNSSELLTEKTDLSTIRTYRVHKTTVRQRLLSYINTQAGKSQLYFWTVSFPQGVTDNTAYKIFNIWLTRLRQYKSLKEYLWVAERQQNGTVHFHIAIPHKMYVARANAMMAGTLKTFAKRGEIPFSVEQCKRYNGVDIAKNRATGRVTNFAIKKGARALTTYLTKYLTKNDEAFTHLAWHNSRGFSSVFTGITFTQNEFAKNKLHYWLDMDKAIHSEWAVFVPWRVEPPPKFLDHLYDVNTHIQSLLN